MCLRAWCWRLRSLSGGRTAFKPSSFLRMSFGLSRDFCTPSLKMTPCLASAEFATYFWERSFVHACFTWNSMPSSVRAKSEAQDAIASILVSDRGQGLRMMSVRRHRSLETADKLLSHVVGLLSRAPKEEVQGVQSLVAQTLRWTLDEGGRNYRSHGGPTNHISIRNLQTMTLVILVMLGLGTRMSDAYVLCGLLGP